MLIDPFDNEDDKFTLICDHCGNSEDLLGYVSEGSVINYIAQGDNTWMKRRYQDEWIHFCSEECMLDFGDY